MDNSLSILPALLAVDPLQPIPVDRLLYDDPESPQDVLILPQTEPLIQLLLLFAQLLAAVAAERDTIFAGLKGDTTWGNTQRVLRSAITIRLQQLTDISSCTPVLLTDPIAHEEPLTRPSKHAVILRNLVLFLKLATLTLSVKADLLDHVQMPLLMQSLWRIILDVVGGFLEDLTVVQEDGDTTSFSWTANRNKHCVPFFVSTQWRRCAKL